MQVDVCARVCARSGHNQTPPAPCGHGCVMHLSRTHALYGSWCGVEHVPAPPLAELAVWRSSQRSNGRVFPLTQRLRTGCTRALRSFTACTLQQQGAEATSFGHMQGSKSSAGPSPASPPMHGRCSPPILRRGMALRTGSRDVCGLGVWSARALSGDRLFDLDRASSRSKASMLNLNGLRLPGLSDASPHVTTPADDRTRSHFSHRGISDCAFSTPLRRFAIRL